MSPLLCSLRVYMRTVYEGQRKSCCCLYVCKWVLRVEKFSCSKNKSNIAASVATLSNSLVTSSVW